MRGHQIEVEAAKQRVRVEIDDVTVADTLDAVLLSETGSPPRYYVPRKDLRAELFSPSQTQSRCPFKGTAGYLTATVGQHRHPDVAWYYDDPLPDVAPIAGTVAFYNDRVDIYLDGELLAQA